MNRTGLGLAIGAGYLLGRTKKLKMALAVGGLVAGKKLNLGPRAIADLVSQQLRDNPQFKELGDQVRGDLRGVGKAASGALVERQLDAFADRLHSRTAEVRDQLSGTGRQERADEGDQGGEGDQGAGDVEGAEEEDRAPRDERNEQDEQDEQDERDGEEPAAKKAAKAAKKAPAKQAAKRPAGKAPGKRAAPAKKAAAKKTAAKKTAASPGPRSRTQKGGGEG